MSRTQQNLLASKSKKSTNRNSFTRNNMQENMRSYFLDNNTRQPAFKEVVQGKGHTIHASGSLAEHLPTDNFSIA